MGQDLLQQEIEGRSPEILTVESVLTRGVSQVLPKDGLQKLLSERRIRLYLGIDPTSPLLHIGHMVPLMKLRQFQQLGHEVILLFGTFTGMIGDPTDKAATRVRLTQEQVALNVATYTTQASRILNFSTDVENPVQVVYNDRWLSPLTFANVVELASNFTVNQLLGRESYAKRIEDGTPLYLHELLYPLMQGYDSVALNVDLEVGGSDQIPNMLAGRTLMERMLQREKWVLAMRLIEDPSGAKMGKTTGNFVPIMALPEIIYEGIMTWPDTAIPLGLELLTSLPMDVVNEVARSLPLPNVNPMHLKEAFAYRLIFELQGAEEALTGRQLFDLVYRQKGSLPEDRITKVSLEGIHGSLPLSEIVYRSGLAQDASHGARLVEEGAVYVNGSVVRNDMTVNGEIRLQLGKRTIKNVRLVEVS